MAGGQSYRCITLTVGGSSVYDVISVGASLSADLIYNRSDCRHYPQQAASTNHMAKITVKTLDLSNAAQSSSSTPLVGSDVGSGGVVLTATKIGGGTFV